MNENKNSSRLANQPVLVAIGLWMLVGQVLMVLILSIADIFRPTGVLFFLKHVFPTIDRTDSHYVFDPVAASRYLTAVASLLPILLWSLFRIPARHFHDTNSLVLEKYKWAYVIFFVSIAIYAVHFRWDDGFIVRVLCWSSAGFSLAGSLLGFLVGYLIRSAVAIALAK